VYHAQVNLSPASTPTGRKLNKPSPVIKFYPTSVTFRDNELRLLQEVLQRAKFDCQVNIIAEEEGEGGTMAKADLYRQHLADVNKMLEKLRL
jgi:hypothetical protein